MYCSLRKSLEVICNLDLANIENIQKIIRNISKTCQTIFGNLQEVPVLILKSLEPSGQTTWNPAIMDITALCHLLHAKFSLMCGLRNKPFWNTYSTLLFHYYVISPYKVKRTRKIWDGIDQLNRVNTENSIIVGTFCSRIINPLFDGLAYNTGGHFAHCSHFSSPLRGLEKYYATRKISARIIF